MALEAAKRDDLRSQRSASLEDKSSVPFSINESNLLCNDYDSAHASIADWVDLIEVEASRIGAMQNMSTIS